MHHQALGRGARSLFIVLASLSLGGCLERELKPLNPCLVSGVVGQVTAHNVDKIDLLFMVDNSSSMKDEQESLAREFPKLITVLTSGDRTGDGIEDFPPVKDLHLGVVSSDLGLPGINAFEGCRGLGDDGRLQSTSNPEVEHCSASTFSPPFLTYQTALGDDPTQLATDFACIARLGIEGCGFEQQLESTLKAVWPGNDPAVQFVTDTTGFGGTGNAGPGFPNGELLRSDSLLALVLVTDEEDCSSSRLDHFQPNASTEGPNTRCFHEGQRPEPNNLFDVSRYVNAFKALRPGNSNLVIFAGIVGVPPELVTPAAMAQFDFTKPAQADAFFDGLLAAPQMQEVVDDMGDDNPQNDNLVPSCNLGKDAKAYPPRRIVEVAKGFGANGVIQSICQKDFGPAMKAIIDTIVNQLNNVCLPRPLVRNSRGLVECNVLWELPAEPTGDAPTDCSQRGYLSPPVPGRVTRADDHGVVCKVAQLPVVALEGPNTEGELMMAVPGTREDGSTFDQGWYYDEFSHQTELDCKNQAQKQRLAFTTGALPPTGVTVKLECLNETQSLANTRTDLALGIEQPSVGDPCENVMLRNQELTGDAACVQLLAEPVNGSVEDHSMFCHAENRVCVQACTTSADCPASWICDDRRESVLTAGRPYCTNPTCGTSQDQ